MLKLQLLFSGGKDSCLAAIMLQKFFEIELLTYNFAVLSNWKKAETVANMLKIRFRVVKLDKEILEIAAEQIKKDGFPSNGIKYIHKKALEHAARKSDFISDGVRRDDRTPILSLSEIRQLEDKFQVHYIQPLMGYSSKTINLLTKKFFVVEEHRSDSDFIGSEYEFELKELIKNKYGIDQVIKIFPQKHTHSIVKNI